MYFFQLFGDKCTRDEFKMFSLQMMSGRQADWVRQNCFEILKTKYVKTIMQGIC